MKSEIVIKSDTVIVEVRLTDFEAYLLENNRWDNKGNSLIPNWYKHDSSINENGYHVYQFSSSEHDKCDCDSLVKMLERIVTKPNENTLYKLLEQLYTKQTQIESSFKEIKAGCRHIFDKI